MDPGKKKNASRASCHGPKKREGGGFGEKLDKNVPGTGSYCHPYPDFPGSFPDRDQHDVQDADTPHDQGDGGDKGQKDGQDKGEASGRFCNVAHGLDLEVGPPVGGDVMAKTEDSVDFPSCGSDTVGRCGRGKDDSDIGDSHDLALKGGQGNDHHVVLVHPHGGLPLGGEDPDDPEGGMVDLDELSDGVGESEESGGHNASENGDPGHSALLLVSEESPPRQAPVSDGKIAGLRAQDDRRPVGMGALDLSGGTQGARGVPDVGTLAPDGPSVLRCQRGVSPPSDLGSGVGDASRDYHEKVRSQIRNALQYESLGARGDAGEDHNRKNANKDPKRGQNRPVGVFEKGADPQEHKCHGGPSSLPSRTRTVRLRCCAISIS